MSRAKTITALTIAFVLMSAIESAHATCQGAEERARWSALAPSLTMELRAERLRRTGASRRGAEITLWAHWDLARLWRARPHDAPCATLLPSEYTRSTP